MRATDRLHVELAVDLIANGARSATSGEDISLGGMFVRTTAPLRVGAPVGVVLTKSNVTTVAWVSHVLGGSDACALAREPGVGVRFADPQNPRDELFTLAVRQLLRDHQQAPANNPAPRIVLAVPEVQLRERLNRDLSTIARTVIIAPPGDLAAACAREAPDVVITSQLIEQVTCDAPIIAIGDRGEHARWLEIGASDVLIRPFTTAEALARVRALARRRAPAVLAGTIGRVSLPSVLAMLEHDRATCRVVIKPTLELSRNSDRLAEGSLEWHVREYAHRAQPKLYWIDLVGGRIVAAGNGKDALWSALDCEHGTFEVVAMPQRVSSVVGLAVTAAVLEHARRRDERNRARNPVH